MRTPLRIFISSPGDVQPERVLAQRVVDRLGREFSAHFDISAIRWERKPLRASEDFQRQIPRASDSQIVVVIIWSRLGTPLGRDFTGALSGGVVTGTEFEFEDAINAARDHGSPDVLVYQKEGVPLFETKDEVEAYLQSSAAVDQFFWRWFKSSESDAFKAAWRTFATVEQFELLLHEHLAELIRTRIETGSAAAPGAVGWHTGSPFRGLESFEVVHAPIFFGRTHAQNELRRLLERQATRERASVVVVGPSGSGKSSLVKAGLIPDLATPGLVYRIGLCRHAIMRPSDAAGDLLTGLSKALLAETALPELVAADYDVVRLRTVLGAVPREAGPLVRQALKAASAAVQLIGDAEARLVVVIDQLEEALAAPNDAALEPWLAVLDALSASGVVWIVATLRADFLQDLERVRPLAERFDENSRYMLAAPSDAELRHIVTRPASTAGLTFQTHPETGAGLDDALVAAARADRTALPLLEYVLEQLWQRRTERGVLTWEAYTELGGLEGAIGLRAEDVFQALPDNARAALPRVLRALVGVAPGEASRPTAQNVPLVRFSPASAARRLVDAFPEPTARLIVASGDGETATVRVAHEALFSHWPRAAAAIAADRKDLQIRARLEQDAARWSSAATEDRGGLLLTPGLRLSEAADLLARRADELDDVVRQYINESQRAYEDELAHERRQRVIAEQRQRHADPHARRAAAEEHVAAARPSEPLARRGANERWRHDRKQKAALLQSRAAILEQKAQRLWAEAYALHRRLRPAAEGLEQIASSEAPSAILSLEVLSTRDGECMIVHYGEPSAPRFVIVDGGTRADFQERLLPRLEELHERWNVDGTLTIELIMVSHYDADRVEGIHRFLRYVAEHPDGRFRIRRLWYNNVASILPPDERPRSSFKEDLREIASGLGVPINEPFDYFVMPADLGPVQVTLAGGLRITIVGPRRDRIRSWSRQWTLNEKKKGSRLPAALERQLDDAVSEAASNPDMVVVRMPPAESRPGFQGAMDASVNNLSSIIAHLELDGRTIVLSGDARSDDILAGLFDAWLLDEDADTRVDVLKVPHFGSRNSVSADLFSRIRAGHYVFAGSRKFKSPRPAEIALLATARSDGAYTAHFVQHDPASEATLAAALNGDDAVSRAQFIADGARSLIVNTMMPVQY